MRLAAVILLIASVAFGEIIPAARRVTWEGNVGIPGGPPTNRATYTTLGAGSSVATIQAALNACPSNQAVVLAAGAYSLTTTIVIPTGVTLKGAGRGLTIFTQSGSAEACVRFGAKIEGIWYGGRVIGNISAGATNGSTGVVLPSATGFTVENLVMVDQLNDTSLVNPIGTYGNLTNVSCYYSFDCSSRLMGQIAEITNVVGNTVYLNPPLFWNYTNTPQAVTFPYGCAYGGCEGITLKAQGTGYNIAFFMAGSKYCWVKDCETDYADLDHAQIEYSFRCQLSGNYFHDGYIHHSGNYDTCIQVWGKSSWCLIENNTLVRLHGSIIFNTAAANVAAYNFCYGNFDDTAPYVLMYELTGNHRAHPFYNLFEGNYASMYHADSYWGSSSHGTLLRNWFTGVATVWPPTTTGRGAWQTNSSYYSTQGNRAVVLDYSESYYNVIGNVLGNAYTAARAGAYSNGWPSGRAYSDTFYELSLGYSDVSDGGGDAKDSTLPSTSGIFHGNYSHKDAALKWAAGIADHAIPNSYYLASKPAWFGSLPWPPFDPTTTTTFSVTNIPAGYRWTYNTDPSEDANTNQPPVISTQPQSLYVATGSGAQFTVLSASTPLWYFWRYNAVALASASLSSYTLAAAYATNAGSYTVILSNTWGNVTSSVATLTVTNAPPVTNVNTRIFRNGKLRNGKL